MTQWATLISSCIGTTLTHRKHKWLIFIFFFLRLILPWKKPMFCLYFLPLWGRKNICAFWCTDKMLFLEQFNCSDLNSLAIQYQWKLQYLLKLSHWWVELALWVHYNYKVNTVSVQQAEGYSSLLRLQWKSGI